MLYLYTWDGTSLKETAKFNKNRSAVTAVEFSSDGKWLAAGESSGKIFIFTDEGSGFQVGNEFVLVTVLLTHFSAQTYPVPISLPVPHCAHQRVAIPRVQ